jgi:hypothetical protein
LLDMVAGRRPTVGYARARSLDAADRFHDLWERRRLAEEPGACGPSGRQVRDLATVAEKLVAVLILTVSRNDGWYTFAHEKGSSPLSVPLPIGH